MARVKIKLNSRGVIALLNDPGVIGELENRMNGAESAARSSAPRSDNDGPHYADAFSVNVVKRRDRSVVQLGNSSDHALAVEARHGTLARAFQSVR